MKNKIFLFLLAAGLGMAGCSSSREGQSGTDTLINGTDTMGMGTNDGMETDTTDTAGMETDTTGMGTDTTTSPQ